MNLFDFTDCRHGYRAYGGKTGAKQSIIIDGDFYILKFRSSLKFRELKNVVLSYDNSPISEYVGSHIYEILGISVHKTILGMFNNKLVVACKDFLNDNQRLLEYRLIKNVVSDDQNLDFGSPSSSSQHKLTNLYSINSSFNTNPILKNTNGIQDHFWNMFVVDAFIGNTDRNNGNWGVILENNNLSVAPVYDNGACFFNKWDDEKISRTLEIGNIDQFAYKAYTTCFGNDKNKTINSHQLMQRNEFAELDQAILRIVPKIQEKISAICNFVQNLDEKACSNQRKDFLCELMECRLKKSLLPALDRVN